MDTRTITLEYRLSHWRKSAGAAGERKKHKSILRTVGNPQKRVLLLAAEAAGDGMPGVTAGIAENREYSSCAKRLGDM